MKKVFVVFLVILLSVSKVNAVADENLDKKLKENKACVQSLNVYGSTRRSNGHQNQWFDMGGYTISGKGAVSGSCFQISKSSSIVNVKLSGTRFSFSPQSHGNASVTITVSSSCTCSGNVIQGKANFKFSEWGLNGLSITGYNISPEFSNMKMEYTAIVPNDVTSIEINAKPVVDDSRIKISINDTIIVKEHVGIIKTTIDNLRVGENKIKINVVTWPENDSRDVYITVTRSASNEGTNNSGSSSGSNDSNDENKVDYQSKPKVPASSFFLIKDFCLNPDVLRIVRLILILIDVVRFVVPMALIVYGVIDFSKAAVAGDEKVQKTNVDLFIKRLINALALFLIPVIVEFLIVFLGDLTSGVNFTDCIQNANKDKIEELQVELDKKREE